MPRASIRATPDEDFVNVEVYSLTSKTPTLLFKDRFEGGDGSYEANVWQGWLIEKGAARQPGVPETPGCPVG